MRSVTELRSFSKKIRAAANRAERLKMTKRVTYHLDDGDAASPSEMAAPGEYTHQVLDRLGYDFYPVGFDTAGNVGPIANRLLRAVTRTPHGRGSSDSPFVYWRNRLAFVARVSAIDTYIARSYLCIRSANAPSDPPPAVHL